MGETSDGKRSISVGRPMHNRNAKAAGMDSELKNTKDEPIKMVKQ